MELLTASEAAARLGVTRQTVINRCLEGQLPGARKVGRDWVIPAESLAKFRLRPRGNPNWVRKQRRPHGRPRKEQP